MKRVIIFISAVTAAFFLFTLPCAAAHYTTYTYSYNKAYQISPNAFEPAGVYGEFGGLPLNKPACVAVSAKNNVYIADTGNNRIVVLNPDLTYNTAFTQAEGVTLESPSGVFAAADGYILVADTGNSRIISFLPDGSVERIYNKPASATLSKDFDYIPAAVCSDRLGRLYILSRDTPGVMVMDRNGAFQGYVGAQSVYADPLDYLWRSLMTTAQRSAAVQFVPINYSNLFIDPDGFLFVTSHVEDPYQLQQAINGRSVTTDFAPVKRLTPSGIDVLKRNGFFPPVGDINFDISKNMKNRKLPSVISAVTVRENGIYSIVDSAYGKIFTYDNNGSLLYAFGGLGEETGLYEKLSSVAYQNTRLLALDEGRGELTVLKMTEYGELIDEVISLQNQRKYSKTVAVWEKIRDKNNNFDAAYLGIGKSFLEQGEYKKAMEYFRVIDNKLYYSKAMAKQRDKTLGQYFLLIPLILAIVVFAVIRLFSFAGRYNKKHQFVSGKRPVLMQVMFAFRSVAHPFTGASDLKYEHRGSASGATAVLLLAMLAVFAREFAAGYLFRTSSVPSITGTLGNVLVPWGLFLIANWCLTSLMDGEGSMRDIYITGCYSLFPLVLLLPAATVLSNFFIVDEGAFVSGITTLAYFWMCMLLFFGMLVIHNYSLPKNIAVTVLSIAGIAVILFIILLLATVTGRVVGFLQNIYNEISFRL